MDQFWAAGIRIYRVGLDAVASCGPPEAPATLDAEMSPSGDDLTIWRMSGSPPVWTSSSCNGVGHDHTPPWASVPDSLLARGRSGSILTATSADAIELAWGSARVLLPTLTSPRYALGPAEIDGAATVVSWADKGVTVMAVSPDGAIRRFEQKLRNVVVAARFHDDGHLVVITSNRSPLHRYRPTECSLSAFQVDNDGLTPTKVSDAVANLGQCESAGFLDGSNLWIANVTSVKMRAVFATGPGMPAINLGDGSIPVGVTFLRETIYAVELKGKLALVFGGSSTRWDVTTCDALQRIDVTADVGRWRCTRKGKAETLTVDVTQDAMRRATCGPLGVTCPDAPGPTAQQP